MEEKIYFYNPTEKDNESRKFVYDAFDVMWENNQKNYRQFNGDTLQEYLDTSRKMINLMAKPRRDGRSNIKSVAPLNKLLAILAKAAIKRPRIKVTAATKNNVIDKKRGQLFEDLYYHSEESMDKEITPDSEYFFDAFDCETDGIKISYEGFDNQTHTRKKIINYNPETFEIKWEEETFITNNPVSQGVAPEDFYVWNPFLRSLQRQPKVCWRTIYDKAHFKYEFANYKNSKYVISRGLITESPTNDRYYSDRWIGRTQKDQVEVLRMFDRFEDRMVIIANGVVLQDTPMIWNNGQPKKYPFAYTIPCSFAGGEFFWGMSLPFRLRGDVDAINTLYNLGIEQSKLAVNPPQLTTSSNEIEDNMLLAGRVLEVDDVNNFKQLEFKSPDQSYFNFISLISRNIDFASVDPVSQGQAVPNVTARGQVIAEENARKLLSQFNMMMENFVLQKAKLKIPNIIQFQIIPNSQFRIENTMVDSESGVREISVVEDNTQGETPSELDMAEEMAKIDGINLHKLKITPAYLNNVKYSIKIIPESAYQQGKSMEIALGLEKVATIARFFPNIFQSSSEIFFKELMRLYDDDPQKYIDAVRSNVAANDVLLNMKNNPEGTNVPSPLGEVSTELLGKREMTLGKIAQ